VSSLYIALLRGINVGGNKKIAMSDLREMLTKLGFEDAQSLLQSGNLIFRGGKRSPEQLESLLETETEKRLGVQAAFFVRTPEELKNAVARNPFREEAKRDPGHLVVMFLRDVPDKKAVEALQAAIVGSEIVRADGRHLYIVYPDGIGRSRLTHALIEKKLGTRGTGRNWNTVLKLSASADS
jgi:uncharacterized protein (DUF1697 family)